jgi:phosphomannomutase
MATIDQVFKAYDIRGTYPSEIDEDLAWSIGHATAQFLRTKLSGYERGLSSVNRVVVGRDMRPHSLPLAQALIEGISSSGATCVDIGMVDTPMVYFAINHIGACGGIQVTASHNPIQYNGFKISGYKAKPVGETTGLREIKHIVSSLRRMPASAALAPIQQLDLWKEYRQHVLKFLDLKRPLKVVIDASNGMAGRMVPAVFDDAGFEYIPLNFEMQGRFVHPPNPLVEANMKWVREGVRKYKADIGICMDGDADRCMFVDEKGQIVRCDLMTALLAKDFLKGNPGSAIVYDLRSSRIVPETVRAAGGAPRRERVGHAFMKKAMAESHAVFGGELSGHFYFRDNFHADSAAIVFARTLSVLSAADKPFSNLVAPFQKYSHSGEINFEVADKAGKMKEIEKAFPDGKIDHLDGVTIDYPDWWLNVRPSNTEPLLRLTLEAQTPEKMKQQVSAVEKILGRPVDH